MIKLEKLKSRAGSNRCVNFRSVDGSPPSPSHRRLSNSDDLVLDVLISAVIKRKLRSVHSRPLVHKSLVKIAIRERRCCFTVAGRRGRGSESVGSINCPICVVCVFLAAGTRMMCSIKIPQPLQILKMLYYNAMHRWPFAARRSIQLCEGSTTERRQSGGAQQLHIECLWLRPVCKDLSHFPPEVRTVVQQQEERKKKNCPIACFASERQEALASSLTLSLHLSFGARESRCLGKHSQQTTCDVIGRLSPTLIPSQSSESLWDIKKQKSESGIGSSCFVHGRD